MHAYYWPAWLRKVALEVSQGVLSSPNLLTSKGVAEVTELVAALNSKVIVKKPQKQTFMRLVSYLTNHPDKLPPMEMETPEAHPPPNSEWPDDICDDVDLYDGIAQPKLRRDVRECVLKWARSMWPTLPGRLSVHPPRSPETRKIILYCPSAEEVNHLPAQGTGGSRSTRLQQPVCCRQ